MFSFKRVDPSPLLTSQLFDEHSFFAAFSRDLKSAKQEVIIESPYITVRRAKEISKLFEKMYRRGVKVKILTRNPEHHDGSLSAQAYKGIQIMRSAGARVWVCDDMRHRKISIFDNQILWEGSLNILSQNGSRELMRRTVSEELCRQLRKFTVVTSDLRWYN